MAITGLALDGDTIDAKEHRWLFPGAMFAHTANPISVHPGIVAGLVVTGLSGAQAQITAGTCVITPTDGERGSYVVSSSISETRALAAPDATYSRIDLIVVRARDAAYSETPAGFTIEPITGTPSLSPVAPAAPTGTLVLAQVTVPTSGVTSAQNVGLLTSSIGGAMAGTRDQRTALPATHLRPGQTFTETTDSPAASPPGRKGQTWAWSGTQWTPQYVTGYRAYIGQVQRVGDWAYYLNILAGRMFALPLRKATGATYDERNDLPCTITSGVNIVMPYAGRYQMRASIAADSTVDAEFVLGIRLGANAATGSPMTDIGSVGGGAGTLLEERPMQMLRTGSRAAHTVHEVTLPQYALAANDSVVVSLWHNSTSTQQAIYENPRISFLDIIRLGD